MTNFLVFLSTTVQENQMYVSPYRLLSRDPWKMFVIMSCFLIHILLFIVISLSYSFYGYPKLMDEKVTKNKYHGTNTGCAVQEMGDINENDKVTPLTSDFVEDSNVVNRISPKIITSTI